MKIFCLCCGKHRWHYARGLCGPCYQSNRVNKTLERYPRRQNEPRGDAQEAEQIRRAKLQARSFYGHWGHT
jgi:hypothetical protein